jgi:hypothetical protein
VLQGRLVSAQLPDSWAAGADAGSNIDTNADVNTNADADVNTHADTDGDSPIDRKLPDSRSLCDHGRRHVLQRRLVSAWLPDSWAASADTHTDVYADTDGDTDTDTDADADADADADVNADIESVAGLPRQPARFGVGMLQGRLATARLPRTAANFHADANSDADVNTDTDADVNTDANVDTDADTDVNTSADWLFDGRSVRHHGRRHVLQGRLVSPRLPDSWTNASTNTNADVHTDAHTSADPDGRASADRLFDARSIRDHGWRHVLQGRLVPARHATANFDASADRPWLPHARPVRRDAGNRRDLRE